MNKWRIDIILKSGEKISGRYDGPETESSSVARLLINGTDLNSFFGISDITKTHNLIIRAGDVSVMDISIFKD